MPCAAPRALTLPLTPPSPPQIVPLGSDWLFYKYVPVLANGTLTVQVDQFARTIQYHQREIPLYAILAD